VKISWSLLAPFWYRSRVWWTDGRTDRWTPRLWLRCTKHSATTRKNHIICIIHCVRKKYIFWLLMIYLVICNRFFWILDHWHSLQKMCNKSCWILLAYCGVKQWEQCWCVLTAHHGGWWGNRLWLSTTGKSRASVKVWLWSAGSGR